PTGRHGRRHAGHGVDPGESDRAAHRDPEGRERQPARRARGHLDERQYVDRDGEHDGPSDRQGGRLGDDYRDERREERHRDRHGDGAASATSATSAAATAAAAAPTPQYGAQRERG